MALLDAETEWTYDRPSRTVRLKTRGDVDPSSLTVSVRVQEYALAIPGGSHHITLKDLTFFATTIHACNSCVIKVSKLTVACPVYRGLCGGRLPDGFLEPNAFGVRGAH